MKNGFMNKLLTVGCDGEDFVINGVLNLRNLFWKSFPRLRGFEMEEEVIYLLLSLLIIPFSEV